MPPPAPFLLNRGKAKEKSPSHKNKRRPANAGQSLSQQATIRYLLKKNFVVNEKEIHFHKLFFAVEPALPLSGLLF